MRTLLRSLVISFVLLTLTVNVASAHGNRTVGDYEVVFGWQNEPAYAGLFNGPELFITLVHEEGDEHAQGGDEHSDEHGFPSDIPVELQAEVSFGPASTVIFFEQAWQEPGHYAAALIPSMPGDYRFHLTGTIGDTPVDLTFDSAEGEFSSVEPLTDILFPAPETTSASADGIDARIAALEARIEALEAAIAALQSAE